MYAPPLFREDRVDLLRALIARHSLGMLVTLGTDGLRASQVPMIIDAAPEPFGTLRGHVARANPQRSDIDDTVAALAIFQGPQHYITPSWYSTKQETGRFVPTWNYVAVHAHGQLRVFDDAERVRALVTALTDQHERDRPQRWAVADAPKDFVDHQLRGIVGFEMTVERLEGTWKVSQNRPAADQSGVIQVLRETGSDDAQAIADLVAVRRR